jgi:hypothetical protein
VLAGGTERDAPETARIGVHRFYSLTEKEDKSPTDSAQILADRILRYLENMGMSSDLFHEMEKYSPDTIGILDHSKMIRWNLLTTVDDAGYIQVSGQDALGNDLPNMPIDSQGAADCERSCRAYENCSAFTFNVNAKKCYLKTVVEHVVKDDSGIMGYLRAKNFRFTVDNVSKSDKRLLGHTYSTPDAKSWSDCMLFCLNDKKCGGFNYERTKNWGIWQKTCSLLDGVNGHSSAPEPNIISGQRNPSSE